MEKTDIEISQNGSLLIYKMGYTPAFVQQAIERNGLNGLRVWTDPMRDGRPEDLAFLSDYTFLKDLDVTSVHDYGFEFLADLPQLRKLTIHIEGKKEIDFGRQTELQYLALEWRKGKIKNIDRCTLLDFLCLIDFNETDFATICSLRQLKNLMVKTASVKTLDGLEHIHALESLLIGSCRFLRSVAALNGLEKLKTLEIESCTKIEDFALLSDFSNLEYLRLTNCKEVESIKFIENFPSLTKIVLNGNTTVMDGDMAPARSVRDHIY